MAFRVSFFFKQDADLITGWSCNFWNTLPDLSEVKTKTEDLRSALTKFTGFGSDVHFIRISDLTGFRKAEVIKLTPETQVTTNAADYSDYPDTAILLKLGGADKVSVNQWIRGIKEACVSTPGGKMSLRPTDLTKFNAIAALLKDAGNGWKLRVRDPAQALKDIKNISNTGQVLVDNHGYENGDTVRIQRCKGFTYPNKLWKISDKEPTSFNLIGWNPPVTHDPYAGGGLVRKIVYVFKAIESAVADRATSHDSGRPFGLRGGRRRRKKT